MTEWQKMLAGELYNPTDPELVERRFVAREKMFAFNATGPRELERRAAMLKSLFGGTGEKIYIEPTFSCDYGSNIHVGEHFYANYNCVILDVAEVRIGRNAMLAPCVGIYTAAHPLDPRERTSGIEFAKPITIGDNCWIGGHAVINPGVVLGNNVVVASGAVVTRSFGDNVVIAGCPARVIRVLPVKE